VTSIVARPAIGSTEWYDALRARPAPAFRRAREAAYGDGQFVGQDSFMTADQILALARAAGVTSGARVLDVCCGIGGPGVYLARELGCRIVGVDLSREGVRRARDAGRAGGLARRAAFLVADAGRLPLGPVFDAALLLETMLAIEDKARLMAEVGRVLRPGGRFGLTVEVGRPLSPEERRRVPAGDAIWLIGEADFVALARAAGFRVRGREDQTAAHAAVAGRLTRAFADDGGAISAEVGAAAGDEIAAAHAQWARWLSNGRVRKLALVLERVD
jgi:SAM-dependent methyltransferase